MARLPEAEGWRCIGEVRSTGRVNHGSKLRLPDAPPPVAFTLYAACDPRDLDCFYVGSAATIGRLREAWRVGPRRGQSGEHHTTKRGPRIFAECGRFLLFEKAARCHADPGGPTKPALIAEELEWLARMDAAGPFLLDNVFGMGAIRAGRGLDIRGRPLAERRAVNRLRSGATAGPPDPRHTRD